MPGFNLLLNMFLHLNLDVLVNSNYLRWGLYSVLAGQGGIEETVVFVAHEVLK